MLQTGKPGPQVALWLSHPKVLLQAARAMASRHRTEENRGTESVGCSEGWVITEEGKGPHSALVPSLEPVLAVPLSFEEKVTCCSQASNPAQDVPCQEGPSPAFVLPSL